MAEKFGFSVSFDADVDSVVVVGTHSHMRTVKRKYRHCGLDPQSHHLVLRVIVDKNIKNILDNAR